MANLSEDIQCTGSDTRPPMLDMTDFASWEQRIRLYCQGKNNGVNILKSIDEGPFRIGTLKETLTEGTEGALHLGPVRPRVYYDLTSEEKIELTKEDRKSQMYDDFKHFRKKGESIQDYYVRFAKLINDMRNIKMTMSRMQLNSKFVNNMLLKWGLSLTENLIKKLTNTLALLTQSYKTYLPQTNNQLRTSSNPRNHSKIQDGRVVIQNVQGRQNRGQGNNARGVGGQDNTVDEDVDEKPLHDLALNVDNVFQADDYPVYDEAGPSYDSDILSKVHDHDHYPDAVCEHHEYVKDNAVPAVQINVSSVPNDAYMMILNDMHEQPAQRIFVTTQNNVTYKEQVELYERRARFELTKREQKIDEQLRIVIIDHNIKEENLKKELHSVKWDTLEIAEIIRKKIDEKMKTPLRTHNKINIRLLDYSKENFLATFTPQTQLTPEQICWSKDVLKMKTEALKEQAKAAKPFKALTVYPRNTPMKLVHRALTIEIKEIKAIFDELEAEVDLNAVNRKCDEIKRKKILIVNDTLIANCLSKEVFYIATNSELNVSRFSEMHDAHTVVQARCLELETELSNLKDKIQKDDYDVMETRSETDRTLDFRALDFQITQLTEKVLVLQEQNEIFRVENAKVKQDYKELYDSIKFTHAKHIDQTTTLLTKNENPKVQINAKLKCVNIDSVTPKVLAPGMYAIDVEPIPPHLRNNMDVHLYYLKHLKKCVETLCEIVEEAKVERPLDRSLASACLYTKHSQELLEYVIGTCLKDFNKRDKK
nr:hypothetical protein [Tanacetum cinerariifolium]